MPDHARIRRAFLTLHQELARGIAKGSPELQDALDALEPVRDALRAAERLETPTARRPLTWR